MFVAVTLASHVHTRGLALAAHQKALSCLPINFLTASLRSVGTTPAPTIIFSEMILRATDNLS